MTTEILQVDELDKTQLAKYSRHNEGLRDVEAHLSRARSRTEGDPDAISPTEGDIYIIPVGAVNDWSGLDNQIAHFYNGSWHYRTPVDYSAVLTVVDESVVVIWDGADWTQLHGKQSFGNLTAASSVAGVLTIDLLIGSYFQVTLTENVTQVDLIGRPGTPRTREFVIEFLQGGGGPYTVAWGTGWNFSGGVDPTLSATVGNTDTIRFVSHQDGRMQTGDHFLQDVLLTTLP